MPTKETVKTLFIYNKLFFPSPLSITSSLVTNKRVLLPLIVNDKHIRDGKFLQFFKYFEKKMRYLLPFFPTENQSMLQLHVTKLVHQVSNSMLHGIFKALKPHFNLVVDYFLLGSTTLRASEANFVKEGLINRLGFLGKCNRDKEQKKDIQPFFPNPHSVRVREIRKTEHGRKI